MDYMEAYSIVADHIEKTGGKNREDLEEALSIVTTRDQFLTNVLNKKTLLKQLNIKLSEAHRYKKPVSFSMLDIDNFKDINDNQEIGGHRKGDEILLVLSFLLPDALKRKTDIFARYGGDEFASVLPATNKNGAKKVLDYARYVVENNSEVLHGLTISGGVADSDQVGLLMLYDKDGRDLIKSYMDSDGDSSKEGVKKRILTQSDILRTDPKLIEKVAGNLYGFLSTASGEYSVDTDFEKIALDCIIEFADKALYHAKNSGRNRVCIY